MLGLLVGIGGEGVPSLPNLGEAYHITNCLGEANPDYILTLELKTITTYTRYRTYFHLSGSRCFWLFIGFDPNLTTKVE